MFFFVFIEKSITFVPLNKKNIIMKKMLFTALAGIMLLALTQCGGKESKEFQDTKELSKKIEKAIELLKIVCEKNDNIKGGVYAFVSKLGENSISLQLIADTNTNIWIDYLLIKEQILKDTLKLFRQNGICFAFPSRTVYVKKDEN